MVCNVYFTLIRKLILKQADIWPQNPNSQLGSSHEALSMLELNFRKIIFLLDRFKEIFRVGRKCYYVVLTYTSNTKDSVSYVTPANIVVTEISDIICLRSQSLCKHVQRWYGIRISKKLSWIDSGSFTSSPENSN